MILHLSTSIVLEQWDFLSFTYFMKYPSQRNISRQIRNCIPSWMFLFDALSGNKWNTFLTTIATTTKVCFLGLNLGLNFKKFILRQIYFRVIYEKRRSFFIFIASFPFVHLKNIKAVAEIKYINKISFIIIKLKSCHFFCEFVNILIQCLNRKLGEMK